MPANTREVMESYFGVKWTDKEWEYIKSVLNSHEREHALRIPVTAPEGFSFSKLSDEMIEYFRALNGMELGARGTQLKDYFKLRSPNSPITGDMLRYAAKHYIKDTGLDNNMREFFDSITDFDKAAAWLTKNASMVALPIVGGKAAFGSSSTANSKEPAYAI